MTQVHLPEATGVQNQTHDALFVEESSLADVGKSYLAEVDESDLADDDWAVVGDDCALAVDAGRLATDGFHVVDPKHAPVLTAAHAALETIAYLALVDHRVDVDTDALESFDRLPQMSRDRELKFQ